jgi:rubrerythrin
VEKPEQIIELLEKYPKFRPMYEQVYEMCRSVERVMGMFSRELKELDDNTVEFMIDELKEMVDKEKARAEEEKNRADQAETKAKEAEEEKKQALKKAEEIQRKYEELLKRQKV